MGKIVKLNLKKPGLKLNELKKLGHLEKLSNDNNIAIGIYNFPDLELIESNYIYRNLLNDSSREKSNNKNLKLHELIDRKDDHMLVKTFKSVLDTQKMQISEEIYYKNINGIGKYLKCGMIPIIEKDSLDYILLTFKDVTENVLNKIELQKEVTNLIEEKNKLEKEISNLVKEKNKLEEENNKYKSILENMSDGLILAGKNGEVEFLNEAGKKFIYNPVELNVLGKSLSNTKYYNINGKKLTLNDLPSYRALNGENVSGMRVIIERPDKILKVDISSNPIYNKNHELKGSITSIRYLNDSLKLENCLKRQRDNFYNIIDSLDLLICRFSYPDFKIIHYNKKVKEEIVYSNENTYSLFLQVPCNDRERIEKKQKNNSMISGSDIKILLNGKERYIETFYQYIIDSDGTIKEIIKVGIDITDKVSHQQELEDILKTQEEFFSFIAHEFRTPLTVMSSTTQLLNLIYRKDLPEKVVSYIDKISLSTLQQLRLVNNLLDITRAGAGYLNVDLRNYDIVSMSKAITESVRSFAVRKNINLEFNCDINEKIIAVDDEKYERILLNLLSNAIKFTPNGKSVKVELECNEDYINIKVKDEGVGIPEDKQEIIFNRFGQVNNELTRKSEGTGIGLCLVRMLINSMGGRIEVRSKLGEGSTFTIILPNKVISDDTKALDLNLMDNRLVQTMDIEFSSIYLE